MVGNMTKYLTIALVAIVAIGAFAAIVLAGGSEAYDGPVDAAGNSISFSAVPGTIVSTTPVITETLIALGYTGKIIGVSNNCDGQIVQGLIDNGQAERVGSYFAPNDELVIGLGADVTFYEGMSPQARSSYAVVKGAGLNAVLIYDSKSLAEIYLNIRLIGGVMNDDANANHVIQSMIHTFDDVRTRAGEASESPKAMVNLGYDWGFNNVFGACGGTFAHDVIVMSNSTNVLSSVSGGGWKKVSLEILQVNDTNPDIMFVLAQTGQTHNQAYWDGIISDLEGDPIWGTTTAVKEGRVYLLKESAANIGQRASPGLTDFAQLVLIYTHPELFNDVSLPNIIGNEYVDFIATNWV